MDRQHIAQVNHPEAPYIDPVPKIKHTAAVDADIIDKDTVGTLVAQHPPILLPAKHCMVSRNNRIPAVKRGVSDGISRPRAYRYLIQPFDTELIIDIKGAFHCAYHNSQFFPVFRKKSIGILIL